MNITTIYWTNYTMCSTDSVTPSNSYRRRNTYFLELQQLLQSEMLPVVGG